MSGRIVHDFHFNRIQQALQLSRLHISSLHSLLDLRCTLLRIEASIDMLFELLVRALLLLLLVGRKLRVLFLNAEARQRCIKRMLSKVVEFSFKPSLALQTIPALPPLYWDHGASSA